MSEDLDVEAASESIKKNIHFRGANVFILACAIIIASVGLNLNSIPVIIGAMLISPLMGPILGFGMGLGTNDMKLVKQALTNFFVMVGISIIASTLYFLISPLRLGNQSELLARTNPTIYDVMIALFGGLAGILETSRKDKGTVLSGVAIATALMPPLCTVGYGLAHLYWSYVFGALYLFFINSIFIALATFLAVKYLGFKSATIEDPKTKKRATRSIVAILIIVLVPSILSAVQIIKEENFKRNVDRLVRDNKTVGKSYIYDYKTNETAKPATIELFMAGEVLSKENRERIWAEAESYGITRNQIVFREEAASQNIRFNESEFVKDILNDTEAKINTLNSTVDSLNLELDIFKSDIIPSESIAREICAQYDNITDVILARGDHNEIASSTTTRTLIAIIRTDGDFSAEEEKRLSQWLGVRLGDSEVKVIIEKPSKKK